MKIEESVKYTFSSFFDIMVYKNAGINSKQIVSFRKIHFQKISIVKYFLELFGFIFVPFLFILNNFEKNY